MKSVKTLFAGPFVGEFGWELFCWQGFLRKMAERFDHVIVACRTGHDLLYKDFADTIIHFDPDSEETNMWNNKCSGARNFHLQFTENLSRVTLVPFDKYKSLWWKSEKWNQRQLFDSYGMRSVQSGFDILIAVRETNKCGTSYRDWPPEQAARFVECMSRDELRVACIGRKDSSAHIPGTTDLRGLPLDELAQVMANARVIVGPQSGPIHLASLCLLPQVCWMTCAEHASRVQKLWNPFNIPVSVIPSGDAFRNRRVTWQPPLPAIVDATTAMLKGEHC